MLAVHIFTNLDMLQLNFRHKKPPQTPSRTVVYYQRGEYGNVALIPAPLKWSSESGVIGQCAIFGIYYYQ